MDRKRATRDAAQARVRVAQAQYKEAVARNGRLNIVAPAAGLVLTRQVEPGQVVGAGSGVLFRMATGGEMAMLAQLGEADLQHVSVGTRAKIGRAHVCNPVTNAHIVCRLMLDKKQTHHTTRM